MGNKHWAITHQGLLSLRGFYLLVLYKLEASNAFIDSKLKFKDITDLTQKQLKPGQLKVEFLGGMWPCPPQ